MSHISIFLFIYLSIYLYTYPQISSNPYTSKHLPGLCAYTMLACSVYVMVCFHSLSAHNTDECMMHRMNV